jgi:hypothetical protein
MSGCQLITCLVAVDSAKQDGENLLYLLLLCDFDGGDVGHAVLVQEPDGQVAPRLPAAFVFNSYRQILLVLARYPEKHRRKEVEVRPSN